MSQPVLIVDVFAERPLEGNPLAVFPDAGGLSDGRMQALAREMNFSETTFITGREADGSWRVRIFTPATELPFAGHPTLGTAWVIRNFVVDDGPPLVTLSLKVGNVPVRFEPAEDGADPLPWLTAPEVTLGATVAPERMARALRIDAGDVDLGSPIQLATVGLTTLIVPLRGQEALRRCRPDVDAFMELEREGIPFQVYVFCREPRDRSHHARARFFFDANGVREDPATGSATAAFGQYLLEHRLFGEEFSLRIEQGYEIKRPSLLRLRGRRVGESCEIRVGGRVVPVLRGELV